MLFSSVHLFVSGRVQGVGFRMFTKIKAENFGLSGWVRNLKDGRVEATLVGPEEKIEEMLSWLKHGPPLAEVEEVKIEEKKTVKEDPFSGQFEIRATI
ncbi:acylphosphatase [Candidatus Shapirobacteria bacterium]|nr:acylphosphatase [Candidatus Shapirobacteria bacterium]